MKGKTNIKREEIDMYGTTLIGLLEVDDGKPIFSNLQDCTEVAKYLTLPYSSIENGGVEARYLAFRFVWWFDALKKTLYDICLDSEEVQIEFVSKDKLKYCIFIDTTSEQEATKIVNEIPDRVNKEVAIKIKNAEEMYDLGMVKEMEEEL